MNKNASATFRAGSNSSAQKKKSVSLTFRVDKGVLQHNNREFIAKNVVRERITENITYKKEDLREKYHELFDNALEEYNSKIRADRRIDDYYSHIEKSKQENILRSSHQRRKDLFA